MTETRKGKEPVWYVYLIRCGDGSLYAGISTDVERRLREHREAGPRGARYLKGRGPLQLAYSAAAGDRARASRLEWRLKRLSAPDKRRLVASQPVDLATWLRRQSSDGQDASGKGPGRDQQLPAG